MIKKIIFFLFKPKKWFKSFWENSRVHFLNWFNNPQNISIGAHSFIYYGNTFFAWDYQIKIWDAVHIAMNNLFITYSHDFNAADIVCIPYDKRYIGGDIIVWDGTWIGTRCTILPGVTIWKWCIVAAWSVVSKNIPDYEVWGWNPAKKISERKNIERFKKLYAEKKFRRKLDI